MRTSTCIDWVGATLPYNRRETLFDNIPFEFAQEAHAEEWIQSKAMLGYEIGYTYRGIGVVVYSTSREDMGIHIRFSGAALNECKSKLGLTNAAIVRRLYEYSASFTRLDIAVDIFDSELIISKLWEEYLADRCITAARGANSIVGGGSSRGQTMYIGRRSSPKMLRIYDKGIETASRNEGEWIRVELEVKKPAATPLARKIYEIGMEVIPAIILGFADFPNIKDWRLVLTEGGGEKLAVSKNTDRKTKEWLLTLPGAIFNYLEKSQDFETVEYILMKIGEAIRELRTL